MKKELLLKGSTNNHYIVGDFDVNHKNKTIVVRKAWLSHEGPEDEKDRHKCLLLPPGTYVIGTMVETDPVTFAQRAQMD